MIQLFKFEKSKTNNLLCWQWADNGLTVPEIEHKHDFVGVRNVLKICLDAGQMSMFVSWGFNFVCVCEYV